MFLPVTSVFALKEQTKFLEEEIRSMEESELAFSAYKNWYGATNKDFRNVTTKFDVLDKTAMEKKVQKLEVQLCWTQLLFVFSFHSPKNAYVLTCILTAAQNPNFTLNREMSRIKIIQYKALCSHIICVLHNTLVVEVMDSLK